jgi:hypothetical protein
MVGEGISGEKPANGLPKSSGTVIFVADNTKPFNQAKSKPHANRAHARPSGARAVEGGGTK